MLHKIITRRSLSSKCAHLWGRNKEYASNEDIMEALWLWIVPDYVYHCLWSGIFRDCIKAWNLIRDDKSMILSWCSLSSFLRYVHFLLLSRFCFTWFLFVLALYMYCYSWNIFMNDILIRQKLTRCKYNWGD